MSKYQFLPNLSPQNFAALKEDIAARGVQVAVEITEQGDVLDGHQRVRSCEELGLRTYPRRIIGGLDEEGRRHHALRANCMRRQLNRKQKRDLIAQELKRDPKQSNRLLARIFSVDDKTVASCRRILEATAAIPQCVTFVGRNGKTYRRRPSMIAHTPAAARKAQTVLEELGDAAPSRNLSPRAAAELVTKRRRERADSRITRTIPEGVGLFNGDFRDLKLAEASVDLIFTDPPWGKSYLPLWADLGAFAARVLKPGSHLVTYTGLAYLPRVLAALSEHLTYTWQCVVLHGTKTARIHNLGIINAYRPLLIFSKGKTGHFRETIADVVQGTGAEKSCHQWGEAVEEAEILIRRLVPVGSLVVDPFMGGGTTLVAARRCRMKGVGCEIDPECFKRAKSRIAATTDRPTGGY